MFLNVTLFFSPRHSSFSSLLISKFDNVHDKEKEQTRHLAPVSVLVIGSFHMILFVSSGNYFQIVRRQCCLRERRRNLHMDLSYYTMLSSHQSSATLIITMSRLNCCDRWWAAENIRSDFRTFRSTGTTSSPVSSRLPSSLRQVNFLPQQNPMQ